MAITAANLTFTDDYGKAIPNGSLGALFDTARVGAATDYAFVTITNTHATLTLTSIKVWMSQSSGAAVAIAVANAPVAGTSDFPNTNPAGLTYSSPTSKAAGLTLAATSSLAPGQKARIAVRRVLSSATAADPQTARLYIGGTSPI